MAAVNKYGYKMSGLKAASSSTKDLKGFYSPEYVELFYNRSTGKVWTNDQCSIGQNSWTAYDDRDIIKICNISSPATMQEISDMIVNASAMAAAV